MTIWVTVKAVAQMLRSQLNIDVTTLPLVPFVVMAHGSGPHDVQYNQEGKCYLVVIQSQVGPGLIVHSIQMEFMCLWFVQA